MREYELVVLFHPDLEIDLDKPLGKVEKMITDLGGNVTQTDNWGKRKLAYPIKKQEFAVYVYFELELEATKVNKLDSTLNITDEVIRHLLVQHEEPPEEEEEKSSESKEEAEKSAAKEEEA